MSLLLLGVCVLAGCYQSHPRTVGFDAGPRRRDAGDVIGRDAASPDAGAPDADGPFECLSTCVPAVVRWRYDGGLRETYVRHELSPCARVFRSIDRLGGALPSLCTTEIDDALCAEREVLAELLEDPRVQALRDEAPVLVGRDDRAGDGTVLVLQIGSDVLEVGSDCEGAAGCREVPEVLRAIEALLQAVTAEVERPGRCDPDDPGRLEFPCGEGEAQITCLANEEVCFLNRGEALCRVPRDDERLCDGPPRCECLGLSLAKVCEESAPGQVTVRFVGP